MVIAIMLLHFAFFCNENLLVTIQNASMRSQHWTAAAWLLERKYPLEFGKPDRREEKVDEPVQLTLGLELEVMDEGESDDGYGGDDNGGDAEGGGDGGDQG